MGFAHHTAAVPWMSPPHPFLRKGEGVKVDTVATLGSDDHSGTGCLGDGGRATSRAVEDAAGTASRAQGREPSLGMAPLTQPPSSSLPLPPPHNQPRRRHTHGVLLGYSPKGSKGTRVAAPDIGLEEAFTQLLDLAMRLCDRDATAVGQGGGRAGAVTMLEALFIEHSSSALEPTYNSGALTQAQLYGLFQSAFQLSALDLKLLVGALVADPATGQYSYASLVAAVIQYAPVEKHPVLGLVSQKHREKLLQDAWSVQSPSS
jgi:hypothetical protein